jgi:hypothetical protein
MATFRQQLFMQFASKGLAASTEAFKGQYQPKKENRFHLDGITYEIGPAQIQDDNIEFEISSKIPQDELANRDDFTSYFAAIKAFLADDSKKPEDIDLENIVHQNPDGEEIKERDYVRLLYRYDFSEMYSDAAVAKDVVQLQKDPTARTLPDLPNVNTLAGRVVLMHVEEFTQREVTERMRRLIEANQEVRQAFSNPSAV